MLVLRNIYHQYNLWFNENKDPRFESLPLMGSPIPVAVIIALYLWFVNGRGQKWMANRQPFELSRIIQVYNLIQVVANAWVCYATVVYIPRVKNFRFFCVPEPYDDFNPEATFLVHLSYFYYVLKLVDLLDTIFFILRKKNNQVTFLHVYHHAGMVAFAYSFIRILSGGGRGTTLGVLNSVVHTMMYGYYFMSSYNPNMKGLLWWKNLITKTQLFQFGCIFVYFVVSMFVIECNNSKVFGWMGLIQSIVMMVMFSDFYFKAYKKKKKEA